MTGASIVVRPVGHEAQPLVIVDSFAPNPDALRVAAQAATFAVAGEHYPGLRAALPDTYIRNVWPLLAAILNEVFGCKTSARVLDASFSIVTRTPDTLTLEQRLPHVDAVEPGRIAIVHYLSPEGDDGTAFYRHRATGFETINASRAPAYYACLSEEVKAKPPAAAYIAGDSPLFERTTLIEAQYNRALVYRSAMLHSGAISPDATLSPDPLTGRLTITGFLAAR